MRTRMFLRTSEFLWQEGHTAHADKAEAMVETLKMLEVYRALAEGPLAMPVVAGEKPENERFPGADATYSIEAMMQDGKALQAGTSHYLGTTFSAAQNIRYQDKDGGHTLAHTTSWGVSTRLIGGVIMTHGDDDGLRLPPAIAPQQVVIIPLLRDNEQDADTLEYCRLLEDELRAQLALGEQVRVFVDTKSVKASTKRWGWVKKGAPIILEIGTSEVAARNVSVFRRDQLRGNDGQLRRDVPTRIAAVQYIGQTLEDIQRNLFLEAGRRLHANIARDVTDLAKHFKGGEDKVIGWAELQWARPTGDALDKVEAQLKALKLTIRNTPLDAAPVDGPCFFTGAPAVERILVGRSY